MSAVLRAFTSLLRQLAREPVLILVLIIPAPLAALLHLGLPLLQSGLVARFGPDWLTPYFPLVDLLIALLPSVMFSYALIMVVLDEADTGITRYLSVTPVTRRGYLLSRLVIPAAISTVYSALLLLIFSLSGLSIPAILCFSVMSGILGVQLALFVLCLSGNKVEGLALVKLSSALVLGIPAPFFLTGWGQYVLAPLPSFWTGRLLLAPGPLPLLLFCVTASIWLHLLYRRFLVKCL